MTDPEVPNGGSRPGGVNAAFWLLVIGAVLLMTGGLLAANVSLDALRQGAPATVSDEAIRDYARLYRGAGILFAVAGVALTAFAVRARDRNPRFRRAAMALGLAVVVVVAVAAVFAGTHVLALLSLLPIIVGTLLLSRPAIVEWYAGG
ncbi:MAG: hypothetical protein KDB56_10175 [Mycobacterium sp.]|nr:hypothetical protein [Mycobacterium sp.]